MNPLTERASLQCPSPLVNNQYLWEALSFLFSPQCLILNALLHEGEYFHLLLPSHGQTIQVLCDISSVNVRFLSHHASWSVMSQAGPLIYLGTAVDCGVG